MSDRTLDYVDLDEVQGALVNPKGHLQDEIVASIDRFGFTEAPMLDERTGRLVVGHGRLKALRVRRDAGEPLPDGIVEKGGRWLIPVQRGWASKDDAEAAAYLLASNQLTTAGGWTDDLGPMLDGLAAEGVSLDGLGWTDDELGELLAHTEEAPKRAVGSDPIDRPVPANPVTRRGDLWQVGPHRLLCGDSMKREDVATLADEDRPELMVTDPPYGVAVGGEKGKGSISGDLTQAVIPVGFAVAAEHLDDNARIYLFGGSANWAMYAGLFDVHLRMQVRPIIWVKSHFILRPNNYHSQFEMVYFGWKGAGGGAAHWYGDRKTSDVWQVQHDPNNERLHPTQKPVEVCAIPIRNSCSPGGIVLDPFAGSGSTLVAAAMLGRRGYGVELSPGFCDLILGRLQALTGDKPTRNGEPYDFTAGD